MNLSFSPLSYLYERKQFGTVIGDFQGMQHQIAQAETEVNGGFLAIFSQF
jgi:short/branched chain acyl-CoA dehydrogenase